MTSAGVPELGEGTRSVVLRRGVGASSSCFRLSPPVDPCAPESVAPVSWSARWSCVVVEGQRWKDESGPCRTRVRARACGVEVLEACVWDLARACLCVRRGQAPHQFSLPSLILRWFWFRRRKKRNAHGMDRGVVCDVVVWGRACATQAGRAQSTLSNSLAAREL